MVTEDRAQLLLVGSIIIAVVFVGLTLVLNSVLFTQNVESGSSVEVTGDINEFNREARRNARLLTIRVNHADNYSSPGTISDHLRSNFSAYSGILAESYADTGSSVVNVSYERTVTDGSRVVQSEDGTFENGGDDWNVVDDTRELGWFVLSVDAANLSMTEAATVEIEDADGSLLTVDLKRSPGGNVLVNSSINGTHDTHATCQPANGRVGLDIVAGTSFTGDCAFNTTSYLDAPYERIRFENGDAVRGKYEIVVNGTTVGSVAECTTGDQPCRMPAAWEIEFTTRYESTALSYENTQNVTAYGES